MRYTASYLRSRMLVLLRPCELRWMRRDRACAAQLDFARFFLTRLVAPTAVYRTC